MREIRKSNLSLRWALALLLGFIAGPVLADQPLESGTTLRILSWNISEDAFVAHRSEFLALVRHARPDILLLDEVAPAAGNDQLQAALPEGYHWHTHFGISGGRQRGVIASRFALGAVPEFASVIAYPEAGRQQIRQGMPKADRDNRSWSMEGGIPVNGAMVEIGSRRLLLVTVDLQCCGGDPQSWHELKRRIEAAEIQGLVRRVLERTSVDGIVLAGDFNLVSTPLPLTILAGPYQAPHGNLATAEPWHLGGAEKWTWDGRGTPFPSGVLDFQLYSAGSLRVAESEVLDSEDFPQATLENSGLKTDTSRRLSNHRPLVVEYSWQ